MLMNEQRHLERIIMRIGRLTQERRKRQANATITYEELEYPDGHYLLHELVQRKILGRGTNRQGICGVYLTEEYTALSCVELRRYVMNLYFPNKYKYTAEL